MVPFDNSFYISAAKLHEGRFETTRMPWLCPYKGLYFWLDYIEPDGTREDNSVGDTGSQTPRFRLLSGGSVFRSTIQSRRL